MGGWERGGGVRNNLLLEPPHMAYESLWLKGGVGSFVQVDETSRGNGCQVDGDNGGGQLEGTSSVVTFGVCVRLVRGVEREKFTGRV